MTQERKLNKKIRRDLIKNKILGENTEKILENCHLDHIIPLAKGGTDTENNIWFIPTYLNLVFSDKNNYYNLKNKLINFVSNLWDINDKYRFLKPNHIVYMMNDFLYKNKDNLNSKSRNKFLEIIDLALNYKEKKYFNFFKFTILSFSILISIFLINIFIYTEYDIFYLINDFLNPYIYNLNNLSKNYIESIYIDNQHYYTINSINDFVDTITNLLNIFLNFIIKFLLSNLIKILLYLIDILNIF